jgi:single-strand DNA-binding protein
MVNQVTLVGKVSGEPKKGKTKNGFDMLQFRVETIQAGYGENAQDIREWHTCSAYSGVAERAEGVQDGKWVCVNGRLSTRKYDKNGETRYFTSIAVKSVDVVKDLGGQTTESNSQGPSLDDIPF